MNVITAMFRITISYVPATPVDLHPLGALQFMYFVTTLGTLFSAHGEEGRVLRLGFAHGCFSGLQ